MVTLCEINEASRLHWHEWFSRKAKLRERMKDSAGEGSRCLGFGKFYVVAKQTSSKEMFLHACCTCSVVIFHYSTNHNQSESLLRSSFLKFPNGPFAVEQSRGTNRQTGEQIPSTSFTLRFGDFCAAWSVSCKGPITLSFHFVLLGGGGAGAKHVKMRAAGFFNQKPCSIAFFSRLPRIP